MIYYSNSDIFHLENQHFDIFFEVDKFSNIDVQIIFRQDTVKNV